MREAAGGAKKRGLREQLCEAGQLIVQGVAFATNSSAISV
jgi:hypothetical protein